MDDAGHASTDEAGANLQDRATGAEETAALPIGCMQGIRIMKTIKLIAYPAIAALSLAAALSAHAEGPVNVDVKVPAKIEKTRAEVQAEVLQARARGEETNGAASVDPLAFLQPTAGDAPRASFFAKARLKGKADKTAQ
jgi:hypothetical protein